jgi:hypothetical protein
MSQRPIDTADQYVFGYISPYDGYTRVPLYQRSYKKYIRSSLP